MKRQVPLVFFIVTLAGLACNFPGNSGIVRDEIAPESVDSNSRESTPTGDPAAGQAPRPAPDLDIEQVDLLRPENLVYLGAFRLPDVDGECTWQYSGHGLTYHPDGDPNSPDEYTGSLFGVGNDQLLHVSEINIPVPVISENVQDLNTAETLQPFADISGGLFTAQDMVLPRAGLEYMPAQPGQETAKLHFAFAQHLQYFEASHGWSELDLSAPDPAGLWHFGNHTNYATNDYLFEIPQDWADKYTPGMYLASGRFREGLWSGGGPALFAYGPWLDGSPPASGESLSSITPLLLYGTPDTEMNPDTMLFDTAMQMNGYQQADHWWGGAWLTSGTRSAVIFTGTKALERSWYGFANGVVFEWGCEEQNPPTCPEIPPFPYDNRGFWAEGYQAQIIFFNPSELAASALGQIETWEPQPYAVMSLDEYLFDPELDVEIYKRDLIGAAAFDREHGRLFIVERLVRQDDAKSIIHVFEIR